MVFTYLGYKEFLYIRVYKSTYSFGPGPNTYLYLV